MSQVRVLIVDPSEKTLRQLTRAIRGDARLSLAGTARNGYEAVSFVAKEQPDVVLMDIEMESRLAGLYAAREILKAAPEVKVVIYTETRDGFHIAKAFQFGASDYLIKDAADGDIIDTVIRAHENRSIIHPEAAAFLRGEFIALSSAQENLAYTMGVILRLTQSELEILKLLHSGMKQREIANIRFIEMTTMKTHVSNILRKFGRESVTELLETLDETAFFKLLT